MILSKCVVQGYFYTALAVVLTIIVAMITSMKIGYLHRSIHFTIIGMQW